MRRIAWLSLAVVILVALPGGAGPRSRTVGCTGVVRPGGSATCAASLRIARFTAADSIDPESLVARIASLQADSWRVAAGIRDARGRLYFVWECSARRSMVAGDSSAYVDRSCAASRRTVTSQRGGRTTQTYYRPDTSGPQRLTVTAWVGRCAPSSGSGCRFEAEATYVFAG